MLQAAIELLLAADNCLVKLALTADQRFVNILFEAIAGFADTADLLFGAFMHAIQGRGGAVL